VKNAPRNKPQEQPAADPVRGVNQARIDRLESLLDRIQRVKRQRVYMGATSRRMMSTEEPEGAWMSADEVHAILDERFK
jgi:hypothetical protein